MTTPEHITVTVDDKEKELFMSFGLLNELATELGDPARVAAIPIDSELREFTLMAILADRKKSGKILKAVEDYDDIDISIEDAEKILDWAMEHTLGFFVRSLQKVTAATKKHETAIEDLTSYLNGSAASVSNKL